MDTVVDDELAELGPNLIKIHQYLPEICLEKGFIMHCLDVDAQVLIFTQ